MRYHSQKPHIETAMYGKLHICNHPLYYRCTLFEIGGKDLAIIQQRCSHKRTFWTEIDPWIADKLYLHPRFKQYFDKYASNPSGDIYPTVAVRQIMWALRMKPLPRESWETYFDRCPL